MKLNDWLRETGKTQVEFAKELGLAENAVSRYVTGNRMPRKATLKKIKQATRGKVTASDFID